MKNPWVVIAVIVVVLVGGSVWYSLGVEKSYNDGVVISDHSKGSKDAKITLVEYSDFECPACGQFEPAVEEVLSKYGDQINFEYKNFPLIQIHPFAEAAAVAAESAAQQGKYFEYHNLLFAKQAEWTKGIAPGGFFTQYAKDLGLDVAQFSRQLHSSLIQDKVRADYKAALAKGLSSTPTFFLNGQKMDLSTIENFQAQIAAAVNPGANFDVTAGNDTLKIVPVTDASPAGTSTIEIPVSNSDVPAPAVKFGM